MYTAFVFDQALQTATAWSLSTTGFWGDVSFITLAASYLSSFNPLLLDKGCVEVSRHTGYHTLCQSVCVLCATFRGCLFVSVYVCAH